MSQAPFAKPVGDEVRERIGNFKNPKPSIPHHVPKTLSLALKEDGWEFWGGEQTEPLPVTVKTAYLFALAAGMDAQQVLDKTRTHCGSLRLKAKSRGIPDRYRRELVSVQKQLSDELNEARKFKPQPEWANV
jgi:hypothetical protein